MSRAKRRVPRGIKKRYYEKNLDTKHQVRLKGVSPEVFGIAKDIAKDLQIVPSPEAIVYVSEEIKKAQQVGTIIPKESKIATRALFIAGAQSAVTDNKSRIFPNDIRKQWQIVGIGNCPPHRCLRRTVIDNPNTFKKQIDLFTDYLDEEL